jgi:aminopeptidase-like protein
VSFGGSQVTVLSLIERVKSVAELLYPHDCGVVTPGNVDLFNAIRELVPAKIHRFESGSDFNGWIIPECWRVRKAQIRHKGKVIFDGAKHPLAVAALSKSFSGRLSWKELKSHIHTRPDVPNAHGYHCMWQYRPWERDWCLCVPHQQFKKWPKSGQYEVGLVTESKPGEMLVADYEIRGRLPQTIVFNAHTCHPRQANDDIVGVAVCLALFEHLARRKNKYTYRLILGPEHLGTVFFLSRLSATERSRFLGGYFLEMPGTPYALKVASSFLGNQLVDRALRHAVEHSGGRYEFVPWRQGAGNDETVWEAPGYEIPFVEFSRCGDTFAPFREYHTSADTLDAVDWTNVGKFTQCVLDAVEIIETNACYQRLFDGLPCLSSPKYDLYIERPDPAVKKEFVAEAEKMGYLADCVLRYLDGKTSTLDIAERHGIAHAIVAKYMNNFAAAKLAISVRPKSAVNRFAE